MIAEGGMATVYLATQESLGRFVALKLLRKFDNTTQSKRFLIEGQILAALNHNNIITIYDIGVTDDERPYISMEYLEGGDLEARIEKGMLAKDALQVVEAIADCLSLVHSEGIIHRDIKPANILFHKNGTPILSDFGIAKQEDRDTLLTMEGSAFGSPYYLSPEQAECKTLDGRTDIYGLGIVLYEMLTGNKPYKGASHIETIVAHMSDPLPVLPPGLSQYQNLVQKMIAKSPADRFPNAANVVQYVKQLRLAESDSADPGLGKKLPASLSNTWIGKKIGKQQPSRTDDREKNSISRAEKILWSLAGILIVVLSITGILIWKQQQSTVVTSEYADSSEPAAYDAIQDEIKDVEKNVVIEKPDMADSAKIPPKKPLLLAKIPPLITSQDAARIKKYLAKADIALKETRLILPKKNSAYFYYQRILDIQPDHPAALKGFKKIADAYADLAEGALNRFNYAQANRFIRKGLRVQPNNSRLRRLEANSDILTDAPKRVFDKIKDLID